MDWRSVKAGEVLRALLNCGWHIKRQRGSHRILGKPGYRDFVFAFHERGEIGPRMLSRIAKHTDITPEDI